MIFKRLFIMLVAALTVMTVHAREIVLIEGPFEIDWSQKHCIDPMQMVGLAAGDRIHVYVSNVSPNYTIVSVNMLSNGWAAIDDKYKDFKVTGDFEVFITEELAKKIAHETIMFRGAGFTVDRVTLITDRPEDTRTGFDDLSNPDASEATRCVYELLRDCYGIRSISCSMAEVDWNYKEAGYVKQWTGKYPAMNGFDYIHLTYSWQEYDNIKPVKQWWDMGGLVTICWHWRAPGSQTEWEAYKKANNDKTVFEGFYCNGAGSPSTTFDITRGVQEGTWENEFIRYDLERVAGKLKLLRDAGIVVIWRPLHEAAGNIPIYSDGKAWFWWGNGGAEPCVKLWRMMYDYFRQEGLDNLIWVWTSQTKDTDWYPGDEYVDMIGRDLYNYSLDDAAYNFKYLSTYYPHKMIALSECGYSGGTNPYVGDQWEQGARWSFAMPWYHYGYTMNSKHQYASDDWWKEWFANDNVVTMDEMKALRAEYFQHGGVGDVAVDTESAPSPLRRGCYTIEGIRVDRPTRPGIYIIDGKKVLVRQ